MTGSLQKVILNQCLLVHLLVNSNAGIYATGQKDSRTIQKESSHQSVKPRCHYTAASLELPSAWELVIATSLRRVLPQLMSCPEIFLYVSRLWLGKKRTKAKFLKLHLQLANKGPGQLRSPKDESLVVLVYTGNSRKPSK